MPLPRFIEVPNEIPRNFQAVVLVFAEFDTKQNTGFLIQPSEEFLNALRPLPLDKRVRAIETICSSIQETLLQYSSSSGEDSSESKTA